MNNRLSKRPQLSKDLNLEVWLTTHSALNEQWTSHDNYHSPQALNRFLQLYCASYFMRIFQLLQLQIISKSNLFLVWRGLSIEIIKSEKDIILITSTLLLLSWDVWHSNTWLIIDQFFVLKNAIAKMPGRGVEFGYCITFWAVFQVRSFILICFHSFILVFYFQNRFSSWCQYKYCYEQKYYWKFTLLIE